MASGCVLKDTVDNLQREAVAKRASDAACMSGLYGLWFEETSLMAIKSKYIIIFCIACCCAVGGSHDLARCMLSCSVAVLEATMYEGQ